MSTKQGGKAKPLKAPKQEKKEYDEMPSKAGREWEYVEKVKALSKGNWTCICKFCGYVLDGGANHIRGHILGLKGYGVDKCDQAPQYIKEACRKLRANSSQESGLRSEDNLMYSDEDTFGFDYPIVGVSNESENADDEIYASEPCDYTSTSHASKKRKTSSQGSLQKVWEAESRADADKAIRRFFFAEGIPLWKVRSSYFLDMVSAVGRVGSSYKAPSYDDLRTHHLNDEVRCIETELLRLREKWKCFGCSIVCDGWSDTTNQSIINIMVNCIYGSMLLRAVDTSGQVKSGEYIFEILKEAIKDVGPENVVQVCMDNETNCARAGYLVEQEWPHIFYTRCTCHCLDLLFEDIAGLDWVKPVLNQALKVVAFVTTKPTILALSRKFPSKDILKPSQTRFAYMFIILANMLDEKVYTGLRFMVVSSEYARKKVSQTRKAKEVSFIVLSDLFWKSAEEIISICAPILKILRLADREGATMGVIYELTNRMIENISHNDGTENARLEEVKYLCVKRWNMMHSPLHAAAYVLHPVWREKCPYKDAKVNDSWMDVIERYTHGDLDKQGVLCDELDVYKSMLGTYARPIAKDEKRMHYAVKWWEMFGAHTPNLQKLALRILSQGTCASPCERNWSSFSLIHRKLRNKLRSHSKNSERLVYLHANFRLATKIEERGFEKTEVTLDMIEKEKDEDRLLSLQKSKEGEDIPESTTILERLVDKDGDIFGGDDDDDDDDVRELRGGYSAIGLFGC